MSGKKGREERGGRRAGRPREREAGRRQEGEGGKWGQEKENSSPLLLLYCMFLFGNKQIDLY